MGLLDDVGSPLVLDHLIDRAENKLLGEVGSSLPHKAIKERGKYPLGYLDPHGYALIYGHDLGLVPVSSSCQEAVKELPSHSLGGFKHLRIIGLKPVHHCKVK